MGLTVLGENLARKGLAFRYEGETDTACAGCKLRKVCHGGLKPGREYVVKDVRAVKHDCCSVFDGQVQVVEVEPKPLPVRVAIPVTALRGTGVSRKWEECGAICLLKQYCNAKALPEGVTAQILTVEGDVPCLVGRKLKFALVTPP